jgi:multidrug efflux pump subunit AcrA (membrane-fusion protein)
MTTTKKVETANTQTTPSFARGLLAVLAAMTVSAALFLIAMTPRWRANAALESAARDQRPMVTVVAPQRANVNADLVLPGITDAIQETAIYARTNGYMRRWLVDIGAKVEAGQLLAEIETPKTFPTKVVRTSGALDPVSHTLLTELQVPNADGQLLPGMSAKIKFELPQGGRTLLIPGSAFVIRADGPKVMTVDAQNAIRFRPVKLGRDLGETVEILSGLDAGDSLVANPSDELREGLEVKVQRESSKNSAQQPNAKSTAKKP